MLDTRVCNFKWEGVIYTMYIYIYILTQDL